MGIDSYITDPSNHKKAHVDCPPGEKQSLIVSTRPLKEYHNLTAFFQNPNFGIGLNIDGSTGMDPSVPGPSVLEEIYDGGDNSLWIGNIVNGNKWDLTSPNNSYDELLSVESVNSLAGDTIQFLHPTGDLLLTAYVSLTMWIYVALGWLPGDDVSIYGWNSSGSVQVGSKILLNDYFSENVNGVWHKLSVPLSDMFLVGQTVDSFRISIEARDTSGPTFYIDDIQLEGVQIGGGQGEGGGGSSLGPQIFTIDPPSKQWYHIDEIILSMASPTAIAPNALVNGTMPYLDYSSFLGITLDIGLTYQRIQSGEVAFSLSIRAIGDLVGIPNSTISMWGDGANTFLQCKIVNYGPFALKGENHDQLRIIVSDDMSGLNRFRAAVGGRIENRSISAQNRALL